MAKNWPVLRANHFDDIHAQVSPVLGYAGFAWLFVKKPNLR
jgi:hypothetical protein